MNNNDSTVIDTKLIELETNRKTYTRNNTVPFKRKSIFMKRDIKQCLILKKYFKKNSLARLMYF